jgi:methylmalonyl-CoA epimerase
MARLNHIGIAVSALPELKKLFALLELHVDHVEAVPDQGVQTHFLPVQPDLGGASLEFLEVIDPAGPVAKFIDKRGPGFHHISFAVDKGTLDSLSARIRDAGFRLIYDAPKAGAHGMRVNFIHPASAGGMLVEIMEPG